MLHSLQLFKKLKKPPTIAVNSAKAEKSFILMNLYQVRNGSSVVGHVSNLMTRNLLGKELADWDHQMMVIP